jgi:flagellar protein FlgJ
MANNFQFSTFDFQFVRLAACVMFVMLHGEVIAPRFGRGGCESGGVMAVSGCVTGKSMLNDELLMIDDKRDMATKSEQIRFVRTVYPAAVRLREKRDSIHPAFVTAQAALETGWRIGGISNNIFGITKGSSWTGKTALMLTTEYFRAPDKKFTLPEEVESVTEVSPERWKYRVSRLFRVYDSLEDCLADHLAILQKPGYADVWPYRDDPKEFARRIADGTGAKYATAPNYAQSMAETIDGVRRIVKESDL